MCISIFSQEVDLEEEKSAGDVVILKKDSMPELVKQAVLKDFEQGVPIQWANFPYLFKEYGWLVNEEKNEGVDIPGEYYVVINAKGGSELDAVYASNGKLIRSREILKNTALPKVIDDAIQSEYKGNFVVHPINTPSKLPDAFLFRRRLTTMFGWYFKSLITCCTLRRVSGLTLGLLFITLETVAIETPAFLATSFKLATL